MPNLNHAQQQTLTDAINAAPTDEVAQHVQTATELDHAMETLKNKVDQVNTDKAQPNYTEASTDKKEAVDKKRYKLHKALQIQLMVQMRIKTL